MVIPASWKQSELGEVLLSIVGGGTPSKSNPSFYEGDIPWMSVKDMNKNILNDTVDHISEEAVENSSTNVIPSGTPIIATRMSLGKIVVANFDSAINQDLKALFPATGVNRDFLIGWYRSIAKKIEALGTGTTVKGIRLEVLNSLEFPLPPLAEQKVIADKLDTLLAQVETSKARLERIPQILKTFRQSVLAAAVSGKLTEEWRSEHQDSESIDYTEKAKEERLQKGIKEGKLAKNASVSEIPYEIPKNWHWFRLGHLALKITDGAHNTPKVLDTGYPYLMAKDLTGGQLDFSESRFVSEDIHRELFNKCQPEAGDLLVVNIGAGTGNNVLIDVNFEFSFKNIAIVKRPSFIAPKYLQYYFESAKQRIFQEQAKGGAQPFLSLTMLNDVPFALPPHSEQTEIVRRVEELFAFADRIEQKANAALERVNNLTQSILAKAFRGELTLEWRAANPELISGENSAEALLKKIKAERAALRKRSEKKTATRKKA
ncbi:restriction endonuclease subunit S [Vibrio fluvialis]|nr:restriction endonuclease subunit S [Vibrio fluvialis]